MADKIILIDTSILIDYYRKTDKENSFWMKLVKLNYEFAISIVTKYEILPRATKLQTIFWQDVFQIISVLSLDEFIVNTAVEINNDLKKKRKQIGLADLFIAATAVAN